MRKFLVLAAVVVSGVAQANVTIDNFTTAYFDTIIGGTSVQFQQGAGIIGGERDVELNVLANPLNQFLDIAIAGGLTVISNGFGVQSTVSLQYDGLNDEVGNTGPGKVLTNAGNGAPLGVGFCNAVRIGFIGNDLKVNITVEARNAGAIIGVGNGMRAAGQGAGFEDIAMAPAVLAAADSLTFRFTADPSGDFAISGLECVPEPASMAALGLGFAALVARRRSKK